MRLESTWWESAYTIRGMQLCLSMTQGRLSDVGEMFTNRDKVALQDLHLARPLIWGSVFPPYPSCITTPLQLLNPDWQVKYSNVCLSMHSYTTRIHLSCWIWRLQWRISSTHLPQWFQGSVAITIGSVMNHWCNLFSFRRYYIQSQLNLPFTLVLAVRSVWAFDECTYVTHSQRKCKIPAFAAALGMSAWRTEIANLEANGVRERNN